MNILQTNINKYNATRAFRTVRIEEWVMASNELN